MSDLKQELWAWQESIDSPLAARLLLVRTIARLAKLEKVAEAAKDHEDCDHSPVLKAALKELESP